MATTHPERLWTRAKRERHLTYGQVPPFRARGWAVVVISAVTEVGVVRAIGYGFGPFTLSHFAPYVDAIQRIVGTPGIATTGQPVEWTGYVYRFPHYVMSHLDREAIPRGIFLFRRKRIKDWQGDDWTFEFEGDGEFLAPLPRGW